MLLQSALVITVLVQFSGSESAIDSGCKGPGVFPHPYDCTQFLICADDHERAFVAESVPCPEGYVFSTSERTCVRGEQCRPASLSTKRRATRAATGGACKASGPYCEDCDRLVVCANMGDHVLMALTNISCSELHPDMTCSKASCTTQSAPTQKCEGSAQAGTFRCLQPGFFPDPADCKLFHVCGSDLSHFSGECDDQFDADLGICTSVDPEEKPPGKDVVGSSTTRQCKTIENACKAESPAPVKFPSYPSYYVICIPVATKSRKATYFYQVSVAKCPGRQEFSEEKLTCEMSCTGKRGRFQDPDNCRSYIECSGNVATKQLCPEKFAFDAGRKSCLPESMVQGCQRTRAVVTSDPNVATTQASTKTSLSTTVGTIPSVGFQCRANGAFPDETDCHRFITCTLESRSDGVYFRMRRRRCPFLTFFNPNGYCQLGFCWN